MAHYDCVDCGRYMGIAFGYCQSCTPPEYFELEKELNTINRDAEKEFEKHIKNHKEFFIGNYKKLLRDDIKEKMEKIKEFHQGKSKQ